mmetsp:Transcript_61018/g.178486  ORF Transcript_61018/g.178486 Transcript_61018/m.178486 type:complete len:218 (-) Transcript_61018:945-1598(-)
MAPSSPMARTSIGAGASPVGVSCAMARRHEVPDSWEMIARYSGLRSMLMRRRGDLRRRLLARWNVHTSTCRLFPGSLSSTASQWPSSDRATGPPTSVILNSLISCEQAALKHQQRTLPLQIRLMSVRGPLAEELMTTGGPRLSAEGLEPMPSFRGSSCKGWPEGQTMMRLWTDLPSSTSRSTLMVPSSGFTTMPLTSAWTRSCVRFSFQTVLRWLRL